MQRTLPLKLVAGAFALWVVAGTWAGCKTYSPSQYVSPRVTGRVLDIQTHQPIKDVRVRRVSADQSYRVEEPSKGGQMIEKTPTVRTAADGAFVLSSERSLALIRTVGWYAVSVSFAHAGYEPFTANYTLAQSTNTASGEPLVLAGDILLAPLAK